MSDSQRLAGPIKVSWDDEIGTSSKPASVRIDDGSERLALHLHAVIEHKKGADGGLYPCVVFKRVAP